MTIMSVIFLSATKLSPCSAGPPGWERRCVSALIQEADRKQSDREIIHRGRSLLLKRKEERERGRKKKQKRSRGMTYVCAQKQIILSPKGNSVTFKTLQSSKFQPTSPWHLLWLKSLAKKSIPIFTKNAEIYT